MTNLIHSSLYVLVLGSVFINVSSESSTASLTSTTQDVETTTHIIYTTSSTTDGSHTTVVDTNIGDFTTSVESDTSTNDFTTTAGDFTTSDESHIDFTTSVSIDSTTTDFETTTATDPITKETTTVTRHDTEITTVDVSDSASTTDGKTTPASATTTTDLSSAKTDSLTTLTDSPTSTATETTATAQVSSTTDTVTSTSIDPDTTTPVATTTTDLPLDATTTGPVCPATEVIVKDDVRNYIIIALSITLGIMIIVIIIWCVLSRLQRNNVSYMKNNMVSMGTQTDDYIPKELYIRPLPPIDTHMRIVSANPQSDVHTKFSAPEKPPIDIHVAIVSEEHVDTKIDIFPESKFKTVSEKEQTTYNSTPMSTPTCSPIERDSDAFSSESEYIDIPDDDLEGMDIGESFNVPSRIGYADKDNFDSFEVRTIPLACETSENHLDSKTCTEHLKDSASDRLFERTWNVSKFDKSNDENVTSKSNIISAGMENKKPSFQIKLCFDEDEEVEEIIALETENKLPTVRHVTFHEPLEQNTNHLSGNAETSESDNGVTLVSSKFRGLVTTKTDKVENSPDKVKINRKRKNVVRKKAPDISVSTRLHKKSQSQKRYEATYNVIAQACFKPERTEEKVWKHLKKLDTVRKLRLKAKTKSKKNIPPAEPKFQSEPYSSLYSRLSHFET